MSTPETTPEKRPSLKPNQVVLVGRIQSRRRNDEFIFTELRLPAPDEYSHPSTVEVRSNKPIGAPGDDVQQLCSCGGYLGKPFEVKDPSTGEIIKRRSINNTFTAIEV
ncbi:hypothetical protein NH8B_2271 [Pseudogulbenkiania sp. NH8B]|uniref:hypothetical protein n=1 Tax=Pseudogulbenkiania sp. (strain NH8B) TaxID=748280 RepID=UPI0002279D95|nr:hypothetical protein [Pseudogulbenkiania sp. NH8B]BAK77085.1 hypothetical protein NH8B_2271 [Pseudogulbenkiania sp. NH8B]